MLDTFLHYVCTGLYPEDDQAMCCLREAFRTENSLRLRVAVRGANLSLREFMIECEGVRQAVIDTTGFTEGVELTPDHVLLWDHVLPSAELYFSGIPADPRHLLADLILGQREVLGDWYPIDAFLRDDVFNRDAALLAGGSGLLAKGPVQLLEQFARILARHGVAPNPLVDCSSVQRKAGMPPLSDKSLLVLIIGRSFVIASAFEEV